MRLGDVFLILAAEHARFFLVIEVGIPHTDDQSPQ